MNDQNNAYYASTIGQVTAYPALTEGVRADVCVVGGGYAGLSSAIYLAKSGLDVVLIEAHTIANGASGRNGGHLSALAVHGPNALEKVAGVDKARQIWDLCEAAKRLVSDLIQENGIQCDTKSGFMMAAASAEDAEELGAEVNRFKEDYQYETVNRVSKSEMAEMFSTDIYHGGLLDSSIIRVNPLQFAHGLAKVAVDAGVKIFEKSEVLQYSADSNVIVKTSRGQVKAKQVVLACNADIRHIEPRLDKYLLNVQSHVIVTKPLGEELARSLIRDDIGVMDTFPAPNYYHLTADHRLMFGSESLIREQRPEKIKTAVRKAMLRIYPQLNDAQIEYGWTGKAAITPNFMPHIGQLEKNVYFVQVPGVTWSIMGGKLVAEAISGQLERFDIVAGLKIPAIPISHIGRVLIGIVAKCAFKLKDRSYSRHAKSTTH